MLGRKKQTVKNNRKINFNSSLSLNSYYKPRQTDSRAAKSSIKASNIDQDQPDGNRILNIILLILIAGLVIYASTLSSQPRVNVANTNYVYHTQDEYQEAASDIMNDFILNRSKLLFRRGEFEAQYKQRFPEIQEMSTIMPLGGRDLSVNIIVSEPFLAVSSGSNTGIVNSAGVLVLDEGLLSSDQSLTALRFTTEQENFTKGSRILTSTEIDLIKLLDKELSGLFINETFLSIDEIVFNVADGQMLVKLNGLDFDLKLSSYTDREQQVGAIVAALVQLDEAGDLPEQYLDARVPGRVFVK